MCVALASEETVRLLGPQDGDQFLAHLLRLGPKGRYNRFASVASDAMITEYAAQNFKLPNFYYGYFDQGLLRGVVEMHGMDSTGQSVEMAFSLELGWRGRGLGMALFARAVAEARLRSVRHLYLHCLAHNFAMVFLARAFNATLRFEDNEVVAVISL
jgi:GNAT superfamily N-acetyltransferase